MAHFAELDQNNNVLRVIVVANEKITENGQESEAKGVEFCQQLLGTATRWVQTSYNGNIRKNYASVGYAYDQSRDAFIPPKPDGDGWVLDEETCRWRNPDLEAQGVIREAAQQQTQIGVTRV